MKLLLKVRKNQLKRGNNEYCIYCEIEERIPVNVFVNDDDSIIFTLRIKG